MVLLKPSEIHCTGFTYGKQPGVGRLTLYLDTKSSCPLILKFRTPMHGSPEYWEVELRPSVENMKMIYDVYENFIKLVMEEGGRGVILKARSSHHPQSKLEIVNIGHPAFQRLRPALEGTVGLYIERVMPENILHNWERFLKKKNPLNMVPATKEDRFGRYAALCSPKHRNDQDSSSTNMGKTNGTAPPDGVATPSNDPTSVRGAAIKKDCRDEELMPFAYANDGANGEIFATDSTKPEE